MTRIAYVNGSYLKYGSAVVHVEDRGYQFSDGVYEVFEIHRGNLIDEADHNERLLRSLGLLRISLPVSLRALAIILEEVVERNRIYMGFLYLQITRGVAKRDHQFPNPAVKPSVVVTARSCDLEKIEAKAKKGIKVMSLKDNRWARPDIKSISLLPNTLAKQKAIDNNFDDAWFVDDKGYVTEGSSNNAWIIDAKGYMITRKANNDILNGITRKRIIDIADKNKLKLCERSFTIKEAQNAREAFITGTAVSVMPVVEIDGKIIANGYPGGVSRQLRELHRQSKNSGLLNKQDS